jgi:putative adenylate-forming enzyme
MANSASSNLKSSNKKWLMLRHFLGARYLLNFKRADKLRAWQQKQLQRFMRDILPTAPFYQGYKVQCLTDLPLMDKSSMLANFTGTNSQAISYVQAKSVAAQAEYSRDFTPKIGQVTVGMSSGTSGTPGLFLVSEQERAQWAGVLLAKTLPSKFIAQLLKCWQPALSIAFFLRANSNLYDTINSRRIDFRFYDLLAGVDQQVDQLNSNLPQVLVAPATVLHRLAQLSLSGVLQIQPEHIISVAEVLEADDQLLIKSAFKQTVHQIYQASEGLLGYSCELGNLHLNEAHLSIQKQWLDESHSRFMPIVTDFSRTTQLIVRYRLNDILRVAEHPCACGRADSHIAAIEGRADQILWLPARSDFDISNKSDDLIALYPDLVRRAMMLVCPALTQYSIAQQGMHWQVDILTQGDWLKATQSVSAAIEQCCQSLAVQLPTLQFGHWQALELGAKRRRIWCHSKC